MIRVGSRIKRRRIVIHAHIEELIFVNASLNLFSVSNYIKLIVVYESIDKRLLRVFCISIFTNICR